MPSLWSSVRPARKLRGVSVLPQDSVPAHEGDGEQEAARPAPSADDRRTVARMEFPSTRAATTRTRSEVESLFMLTNTLERSWIFQSESPIPACGESLELADRRRAPACT